MTKEYNDYIDFVIGNSEHLNYNSSSNAFEISKYDLSWEDLSSLSQPIKRMRSHVPPEGLFQTKVGDIKLDFYDKYLEDYCSDRLENNLPIRSTDLIAIGDKTHIIGRIPDGLVFSKDKKLKFLKSLQYSKNPIHLLICKLHSKNRLVLENLYSTEEGWILLYLEDTVIYSSGLKAKLDFVREKIKKAIGYYSEDRILGVIKNIRENGWDDSLTWSPHIGSSEIQGSVIGFSTKSSTHSLITGRHRITAAVYLHKKGELNDDITFDYPKIIYPWKTWVYDNV